ncbi:MAG TPA: hypothetical protein VEA69_13740 [Tepidisphaeraceae bacterium]|nr:hypothetical protein [Tepidisphaeraceae bacterium]
MKVGTMPRTETFCGVEGLESRTLLAAGALDPTFGPDHTGASIHALPAPARATAAAVAQMRDGRIVTVGTFEPGDSAASGLIVARYLPDGAPDTTFGPARDGKVSIPIGTSFAEVLSQGIQILPDGKIVVGASVGGDIVVAVIKADGTTDPTLTGAAAYFCANAGNGSANYLTDLVVRPDGRILVAGYTTNSGTGRDLLFMQFHSNGVADDDFGNGVNGKIVLPVTKYDESVEAIELLSDGSVLAVGTCRGDFMAIRLAPDGGLDKSFGTRGVVRTDFGRPAEVATALAVMPDGRFVLGGRSGGNFAAARYLAGGPLDTTFGNGGLAKVEFGTDYDSAHDIDVRPDGRVLLVGTTARPSLAAPQDVQNSAFAAARLTADGQIDTTYGTGGLSVIDFTGAGDVAMGVVVRRDGRAVVAGYSWHPDVKIALTRLTSGGQIDTGFGDAGTGKVHRETLGPTYVQVTGAAELPDGKTLVVGPYDVPDVGTLVHATRFNADGTIDTTFGSNGTLVVDLGGPASTPALVVQADGKFIIVSSVLTSGNLMNPTSALRIARFNADGTPDTGYGAGGTGIIDAGPTNTGRVAITLDSAGRLIVDGVRRYTTAGVPDTTFGTIGLVMLSGLFPGASFQLTKVLTDPAGRLVLVGQRLVSGAGGQSESTGLAIVRLTANGLVDTTFSPGGSDGSGVLVIPHGESGNSVWGADVGPGGEILIGERRYRQVGEGQIEWIEIVRVTSGGAFDTGFGAAGRLTFETTQAGTPSDLAVDEFGRILIASTRYMSTYDATGNPGDHSGMYVTRLEADGTLDGNWGLTGSVQVNPTTRLEQAVRIVIRADGRVLVAGMVGRDLVLAQLTGDAAPGAPVGVTATIGDGVLRIVGTPGADQIKLTRTGNTFTVSGVSGSFAGGSFSRISVDAKGGDDVIDLSVATVGSSVDTGFGDDLVLCGSGDDTVFGWRGNDTVFGGAGRDWVWAGLGNDYVNPGPGVDTVLTGDGRDQVRADDGGIDSIYVGAGPNTVVKDAGDTVENEADAPVVTPF